MYREGDVQQALTRLGVLTEQRNRELQGYCPMHLERVGREDHNPSWSMNSETGVHHCFSCGYKGTLLTLVAEVRELKTSWDRLDLDAAKEWLRANVEVDFEQLSKQLEEMRESYVSLARPVEMSEARLAVFDEVPDWALQARGLSKEACWAHGVMWDRRQEAWITPIRSAETDKLLGWQEKGQSNRVFRNRPTGVKKSTTLFGLDVWLGGTMVIVESPLDVVKLSSTKLSQGVSTFGASISAEQVALFRKAEKLIFAFDNPSIDKAGEKASKDMFSLSKELGFECWFFNYGSTGVKDIGDMGYEQIEYGITKAKHCVFGEKAIYGDGSSD
jgi:DNA primase